MSTGKHLEEHYIASVNRELDKHLEVAQAHDERIQRLEQKTAVNATFVRVGILVTGFLLSANLALLGYLFNRMENLQRMLLELTK